MLITHGTMKYLVFKSEFFNISCKMSMSPVGWITDSKCDKVRGFPAIFPVNWMKLPAGITRGPAGKVTPLGPRSWVSAQKSQIVPKFSKPYDNHFGEKFKDSRKKDDRKLFNIANLSPSSSFKFPSLCSWEVIIELEYKLLLRIWRWCLCSKFKALINTWH